MAEKKRLSLCRVRFSTSGFCALDILHSLDALGNPVFCAESGRDSAQNLSVLLSWMWIENLE